MPYTTIKKPSDYFNTVLYTGNGSTQSITGVGFQPDLVWGKIRNDARKHNMYDAIRGVQKRIVPNSGASEDTVPGVTSFDSDGFTVGAETDMNQNTNTFVSWNWLASNTTTSNTDGDLTSTVSVNSTSGFSIVSYTGNGTAGTTVGHGLGATADFVIVEGLDNADLFQVICKSLAADKFLQFATANAFDQSTYNMFNSTRPNDTVITLGDLQHTNANGQRYIAYCFAEKKGFSKIGSYFGNGNADGSFIYLGFKPAFVITKRTDSASDWVILDNKRNSFNVVDKKLESSNSDADTTQTACDFLSNGIKLKDTTTSYLGTNISGGSYIYMAFAEKPLVGDNPATAR